MNRAEVDAICAGFPGAVRAGPGELDSWKVGGKMFLTYHEQEPTAAVKTASVAEADMLIASGVAMQVYYLHPSWVRLAEGLTPDAMRPLIQRSYDLVVAGLPKRLRLKFELASTPRCATDRESLYDIS